MLKKDSHIYRIRDFTLMELVGAHDTVMTILMTIMLPALKLAQDMAKTIACVGNMRQYSIAYGMYENDFKVFFPLAGFDDTFKITVIRKSKYKNGKWSNCDFSTNIKTADMNGSVPTSVKLPYYHMGQNGGHSTVRP